MKKLFLFLTIFFYILISFYTQEKIVMHKYEISKIYYPWMTEEIYNILDYYCNYWESIYDIDIYKICSLINEESGSYCNYNLQKMEKVISHAGAIGIMQVMPFHAKNPKKLSILKFNIEKGIWYFAKCMRKSKGNLREASRMYNAGLNNKRWKYKNWKYVKRIVSTYNSFCKKINNQEILYAMR